MDGIIALAYAKSKTAAISQQISDLPNGFNFKGAVDYVSDLPATGNESGDTYTVRYAGSSGDTPIDQRYAWGDDGGTDAWIPITPDLIALTNAEIDTIWEEN